MAASIPSTSPHRVRVDASAPAPWCTRSDPSIVHVGHSAIVLRDGRRLLVLSSDAFGLVPGGVELAPADLAAVRRESASGVVRLAHWRPAVVEPVDLTLRPAPIDPDAVRILAVAARTPARSGLDPARQRADAPALARAAVAGLPLEEPLLRLIGAGPGSTPAGDDVVAGVLAGLHIANRPDTASRLAAAVLPLLPRTTSASAHYLTAAADGRFAVRVHDLLAGLASPAAANRAARVARAHGGTSGLDLLAGIAGAASSPSTAPALSPIRRTA
jgi:hypothetical protein